MLPASVDAGGIKIRKATGREMYSEIYKPITEGIESQKEELSSQLKALPGIKEQLALLPKSISEDLTQGITELTKGLQEAEKPKIQDAEKYKIQEYTPINWGNEFKELEDYRREKIGIKSKR